MFPALIREPMIELRLRPNLLCSWKEPRLEMEVVEPGVWQNKKKRQNEMTPLKVCVKKEECHILILANKGMGYQM